MTDVNLVAIAVATVAVFIVGGVYYAVLGSKLVAYGSAAAEQEKPSPWLVPFELVRSLAVAAVVAGLVVRMDLEGWGAAALLGIVLWIAFPVVLLAGSVFHEKVPWKLAALHAGDWLVKLVVVSIILTLWR